MIHCLGHGEVQEDKAAQRRHAAIMRRFRRITEEYLDEPLYIPELCKEIGTSLRTLNVCCQEHLGMGCAGCTCCAGHCDIAAAARSP